VSGPLSLPLFAAEPEFGRPATSNTLRQPNAASGWQRKGTGNLSPAASTLPRPFDQPDDIPATASTKAPWAEPVSNEGAEELAPEPAIPAGARIRHVTGSVNSPNKPLTWRMKSAAGTTVTSTTGLAVTRATSPDSNTIRRTAHLQDAVGDETSDLGDAGASSAPEFNPPQATATPLRTAQGRTAAPQDPAVPVQPPAAAEAEPLVEPTPPAANDDRPAPTLRAPRGTSPNPPAPPSEEPEATPPARTPQTRPLTQRGREPDFNLLRDVPCERMYGPDKNRNCCAEELLCGEARKRVKQLTIGRIKVDITPTCNLAGEWSDAPETKCGWQLELSPVRPWKNRLGEQVAHGRFSGFAHARVVITDENGAETKLKMQDLSEDDRCFVTAWCGLPFECGLVEEPLLARNWQPLTMTWKASALCHKPLYFEDAQLERYGHTSGPILQPFVSGAHFFANIALLPYNMGIHPMSECQYALGYYRPGVCAPRIIPPFPLSARGALMEAGAVVGGIYLIP